MERALNPRGKRIMANDPSFGAWGWAVFDTKGKILDAGAIKTVPSAKTLRIRKGDDRVRRISELNTQLLQVISHYNVKHLVVEQPHGSQSSVAALMIGAVTAIMQTIGDCKGFGVEWYSEGDAKMAVAGKRSVGNKDEMVRIINSLYPDVPLTGKKWIDQAVADAVAVYHVAQQHSEVIKFLKGI